MYVLRKSPQRIKTKVKINNRNKKLPKMLTKLKINRIRRLNKLNQWKKVGNRKKCKKNPPKLIMNYSLNKLH